MSGFVDLHCHCVPGIDDGVRSVPEALSLLGALGRAGFTEVVATPHMRAGMFDNAPADLTAAFDRLAPALGPELPKVSLSSEHYFDDLVFQRLLAGEAMPYPGGRAVLLEFYEMDFGPSVANRLFDLRRRQLIPVIAHPERYRPLWKSHDKLADLVRSGAAALLDTAALVGKYGKEPQRCAEKLLKAGIYQAACSDAHRPADVEEVVSGMRYIEKKHGKDRLQALFARGPREILAGTVAS